MAQTYETGTCVYGGKVFQVSDDGTITDERADVCLQKLMYDEHLNPREPRTEYFPLSKCFISFNSQAQKVRTNDGRDYIYSYYVFVPLKKSTYHLIPHEGEMVRIKKADGTIDATLEVKGFVTYKRRYLKLWL